MTQQSRQALFAGTEAPPPHLALEDERLAACLREHLDPAITRLEIAKFRGGQSNPTYLIGANGSRYILRRKPPGELVASAHDIEREYRVMRALFDTTVPVPRTHFYCHDAAIIGSEFYVADYVEGRVFWDADMPGVAPADRAAAYGRMNATLADLHQVDCDKAGLEWLGRSDSYVTRNLARWSKNYAFSRLIDIPDMDWLIAALAERIPAEARTTLIHGDYGLYNLILQPSEPSILAVLDWEMVTRGDPFVDLAHHLRAWWEIPDDTGAATSLSGLGLDALGIPRMEDYIARYCARRSVAVPDMRFYLGFAQFRYAAMIQGILKRAQDGTSSARRVLHHQDRVIALASMARRTLES